MIQKKFNPKTNREEYDDLGEGHSGPFSSDYHASGMHRYLGKNKRKKSKNGISVFYSRKKVEFGILFTPKESTKELNPDPKKYKLFSKLLSIIDNKKDENSL